MLPLLKPSLYAVDAGGQPVLLGGRCTCGHTFFPMTEGCGRCGNRGDALTPTPLAMCGELLATATVYTQADVRAAPKVTMVSARTPSSPVMRTEANTVFFP